MSAHSRTVLSQVNSSKPVASGFFKTRGEWFKHELKFHRQEWYCNDCGIVFKAEKELENHLRHVHPDTCTPVLLPVVIKGCQRISRSSQCCVLCTAELPAARIRNHLARHLQQLALCSLPRRQDIDSDVEDETAGEDESGGSSSTGKGESENHDHSMYVSLLKMQWPRRKLACLLTLRAVHKSKSS